MSSFKRKVPENIDKAVNKAIVSLSMKCKPCLVIVGTKPEEMMLSHRSVLDDYSLSTQAKQVMTKLADYAYHRGVLDGIEKAQNSIDVDSQKSISFNEVIGVECRLDLPDPKPKSQ